jgi:hypothetical protein
MSEEYVIINTGLLSSECNSKDSLNPFIFYFPGCYKKILMKAKKYARYVYLLYQLLRGGQTLAIIYFATIELSYGAEEALFACYVGKNLFI